MNTIMEYKGFKARVMIAPRLKGDYLHALPPGDPAEIYYADEFKKWPENWMKGPGVFLVPVPANKGLWFDWRLNSEINTAVLPTVKGSNPVTGLKTSGFHLERYDEKCPKHGCSFEGDRFCPKCKYKWPPQNYVTGSPLWWDGWRSEDGNVRQFFFTEDEMRDVATHMIGKENTVPAFGFAFYRPKEMRQEPQIDTRHTVLYEHHWYENNMLYQFPKYKYLSQPDLTFFGDSSSGDMSSDCVSESKTSEGLSAKHNVNHVYMSHVAPDSFNLVGSSPEIKPHSALSGKMCASRSITRGFSKSSAPKPVKEVSVGAGAKINQALVVDPYPLDTWRDKPDASMTIYFVFQEKLEELKAGGMKDLEGTKEGMLDGVPVG